MRARVNAGGKSSGASVSPNVRVLAIDDAPFARRRGARVVLIAVLARGARQVEGVFSTRVVRDGWGATAAIAKLVRDHALATQARYVLLDGVAVGGFNVVDLPALHAATGLPVIAVMRRAPDLAAVHRALAKLPRAAARARVIARAGAITTRSGAALCLQCAGCSPEEADAVLRAVTVEGNYPEPLRLAHVIGAGVMLGRNKSRA